jgi:Na+-translocating ferredoxin:NAD+ oxidoreductase subunit D
MTSPYVAGSSSVTAVMFKVMLAMLPGIAAFVWYFGPAILVSLAVATVTALVCEALMLWLRRAPMSMFLTDFSAIVTAWLLALSLPPLAPWWLVAVGTAFAIIVAKHLYGGLGSNPFNPAMAGFAVLLIAFPLQSTRWPPPLMLSATRVNFDVLLAYIFPGWVPAPRFLVDAETMATPLDVMRTHLGLKETLADISYMPIFGQAGGVGFEMMALGYLLGGLYLLQQRVISWHMPAAFLGGLGGLAGVLWLIDPAHYASPLFHFATGGALLGAFFIITDPVSGATTPKGKLIYAAAAGAITYVIRTFGGYADGVAFAVLLMNMLVPIIDARTQPAVFGRKGDAAKANSA